MWDGPKEQAAPGSRPRWSFLRRLRPPSSAARQAPGARTLALLPVLPGVYALPVVMGLVAVVDELQRRTRLQAGAFGQGATVGTGLAAGSPQALAGPPPLSLAWSVPRIAPGRSIGLAVAARRCT